MSKLIHCKKYRADQPASTCVARQKIIARYQAGAREFYAQTRLSAIQFAGCVGCKTGLKLYHESLKGVTTMPDMKTCANCKKMLPADTDHFDVANRSSDGLTNFCRGCRGTAESNPTVQGKQEKADNVDKKSEPQKKEIAAEFKTCAWPECGKDFTRLKSDTAPVWANRKFCSKSCADKAERKREIMRKRNRRAEAKQAMVFDPDAAAKIAHSVTEDMVAMVAPFVDGTGQLDQIKAVAERVGIECQRRIMAA